MMHNKKGIELSINMVVVLILGITLMGVGMSIFYNAYNKAVEARDSVDEQTQRQLNKLLDTGEAIVVPINTKDADRGKHVDFDLAIRNELNDKYKFFVYIRYAGYFNGNSNIQLALSSQTDVFEESCWDDTNAEPETCADKWVLIPREYLGNTNGLDNDRFILQNNEQQMIPIRISLPRKARLANSNDLAGLPSGQYAFNVDVYKTYADDTMNIHSECEAPDCTPYFSRKKLYIKVT